MSLAAAIGFVAALREAQLATLETLSAEEGEPATTGEEGEESLGASASSRLPDWRLWPSPGEYIRKRSYQEYGESSGVWPAVGSHAITLDRESGRRVPKTVIDASVDVIHSQPVCLLDVQHFAALSTPRREGPAHEMLVAVGLEVLHRAPLLVRKTVGALGMSHGPRAQLLPPGVSVVPGEEDFELQARWVADNLKKLREAARHSPTGSRLGELAHEGWGWVPAEEGSAGGQRQQVLSSGESMTEEQRLACPWVLAAHAHDLSF